MVWGGRPRGDLTPRRSQSHTCIHTRARVADTCIKVRSRACALRNSSLGCNNARQENSINPKLLHKILFQESLLQSPPSLIHLFYYTRITNIIYAVVYSVYFPPLPKVTCLHPCVCHPVKTDCMTQHKKTKTKS